MRKNRVVLFMTTLAMLGFLVGCAGYPMPKYFKGESATFGGDNVLRNDILREIYQFEKYAYNCDKIFMIGANIISAKEIAPNRRYVEEHWTAIGCNTARGYKVTLTEDENKEVDFTVSNEGNQTKK